MATELMCQNCALQRHSTIIAHGINVTRNSSRRCHPPPPASSSVDATMNSDPSTNNNNNNNVDPNLHHQFSVRMAKSTTNGESTSPPPAGGGGGRASATSSHSSESIVTSSATSIVTGTRTTISVQIVNGGNSGSGGIGSGGPCSITTSRKHQNPPHQEEDDPRNRPYGVGHGVFKSQSIFPAPQPGPCQHHQRRQQEEGEDPAGLHKRKMLQQRSKLTNTMSAPSKLCSDKVEGPDSSPAPRGVAMERLRRSFRDSFRKKKESGLEASKPHQWQHDEAAVRAATCAFPVKYLGCVEVFESRGMQVCEEALKVLRASRRRPIRGMLHVSGDGLRVVDDETKGLLVDQTIEKVSFCAPDRNHERGFSYICRDGTTRRWMCHGFVAIKETGERLSHAVGCAFAACLDRKQKRDKECGVTMTFDQANNTFTRMGSFKQMSITDRLTDPQVCKPNGNNGVTSPTAGGGPNKAPNPHAIARPHATPLMLQRQGSCRVFHHLNESSPFKRQLSLRLNDLPSNMERQRSHSLTSSNIFDNIPDNTNSEHDSSDNGGGGVDNAGSVGGMSFPSDAYNNNGAAYGAGQAVSSIPEDTGDSVSALCQELWQGLSLLSSDSPADSLGTAAHPASASRVEGVSPFKGVNRPVSPKIGGTILVPSVEPIREEVPWSTPTPTSGTKAPSVTTAATTNSGGGVSKAEEWLAQLNASSAPPVNGATSPSGLAGASQRRNPPMSQLRANTMGGANPIHQPQTQPPAWNPTVPAASFSPVPPSHQVPTPAVAGVGGMPLMGGARQPTNFSTTLPSLTAQGVVGGVRRDPFDAEWVSVDNGDGVRPPPPPILSAAPPLVNPNNPFLPASTVTKAFEVQM